MPKFPPPFDWYVNVKDYGAAGDGVTDDAPAVQAAINAVENQNQGGAICFPSGEYLLGSTITLTLQGIHLIGAGASQIAPADSRLTVLRASHSAGPVVRVMHSYCGISNLIITATAGRTAGAAGANYGILHEGADVAGDAGIPRFCIYSQLFVANQPSHGVVLSAGAMSSVLQNSYVRYNEGHAIVCDNGTLTGRANVTRCGMVYLKQCVVSANTGHGLVLGGDDGTWNVPYRIIVDDCDFWRNALAAGIRRSSHNLWLYCENSTIRNSGIGGYAGLTGLTPQTGAIWVAGRAVRLENNRHIQVTPDAITVDNLAGDGIDTIDITVDNMTVDGPEQANLDPAIVVGVGVVGPVNFRAANNRFITRLAIPSGQLATSQLSRGVNIRQLNPYWGLKTSEELVINDDAFTTLEFDDNTRGVLVLSGNTADAKAAVVHFRVGTSNSCALLAGSAGVTVTTGALNGTTGADGDLTISTHSDKKVYIENRTGVVRSYVATLLSSTPGGYIA